MCTTKVTSPFYGHLLAHPNFKLKKNDKYPSLPKLYLESLSIAKSIGDFI
jgi:hypothetical protein